MLDDIKKKGVKMLWKGQLQHDAMNRLVVSGGSKCQFDFVWV